MNTYTLPEIAVGCRTLPVSIDNELNRFVFHGRVSHMSVHLLGRRPSGEGWRRYDTADFPFRPFYAPTPVGFDELAHSLVTTWIEGEILSDEDPEPSSAWKDNAVEILGSFLEIDAAIHGSGLPNTRAAVMARMPETAIRLAAYPDAFLEMLDDGPGVGMVKELLCYYNPLWRRVSFIYGSPYDYVNALPAVDTSVVFSKQVHIHDRKIWPPPCLD